MSDKQLSIDPWLKACALERYRDLIVAAADRLAAASERGDESGQAEALQELVRYGLARRKIAREEVEP
jgi:hypothetical protein